MVLDLFIFKVCNMLDDYGDDFRDFYLVKFVGKFQYVRFSVNIMYVFKLRKLR